MNGEWDVSWLGNNAGYLVGTAFPTWEGNTVITGHVWNAYNQPAVFADLKDLRYGNQIKIHAWDQVYTYLVQESRLVSPYAPKAILESKELDWVTIFTCEGYQRFREDYSYRRVVLAVLVSIRAAE
jgi:LPXTG-site transpeptidase (sortase) family protein